MNWIQFHIHVEQAQVEFAETLLMSLGAVSVTLDDAEDQALLEPLPNETPLWDKVIVTGIFQQTDDEPVDVAMIEQFLRSQMAENTVITVDELEDQVWERAWMDYYEPIQIDEHFWVVPEWLTPPDENAVNLKLDPGLAFGTGNHASTFLCLQWLGQADLKDKIVIDYGCGSGILAVASLLLGAKAVYATDIDPQAVLATQQNAELNGVADRIWVGLPEAFEQEFTGQADVLVANILATPLMMLAPKFSQLVKKDATFALAGVIEEQCDDVCQTYQNNGFVVTDIAKREETWCRIAGYFTG